MTTSNDCWCRVTIGRLETAPPLPQVLLRRRAADEGAVRQYVLLKPKLVRYSRRGSVVRYVEGLPTCYRRSTFFADPGRTIGSAMYELTDRLTPWPSVFESLMKLTANMATRVAENPKYAQAPVVPLKISIIVAPSRSEREERLVAAVSELSLAEAVAAGPRKIPADISAIEALEEAAESGEYQDHDQCTVCLEEFGNCPNTLDDDDDDYDDDDDDNDDDDDDKKVLRMPCSHVYHKKCIVEWLERSHLCPLCRYAMPTITTTT